MPRATEHLRRGPAAERISRVTGEPTWPLHCSCPCTSIPLQTLRMALHDANHKTRERCGQRVAHRTLFRPFLSADLRRRRSVLVVGFHLSMLFFNNYFQALFCSQFILHRVRNFIFIWIIASNKSALFIDSNYHSHGFAKIDSVFSKSHYFSTN